jgi:hypothetical protein
MKLFHQFAEPLSATRSKAADGQLSSRYAL